MTLTFLSKEDNAYLLAVHDIKDILIERLENPLLQMDFLFNLSRTGRKFYRAVNVSHGITEKVSTTYFIQQPQRSIIFYNWGKLYGVLRDYRRGMRYNGHIWNVT